MTLSETAVKPIYESTNAMPACDVSQVDMDNLLARIRHHVLTNRLRVCHYLLLSIIHSWLRIYFPLGKVNWRLTLWG